MKTSELKVGQSYAVYLHKRIQRAKLVALDETPATGRAYRRGYRFVVHQTKQEVFLPPQSVIKLWSSADAEMVQTLNALGLRGMIDMEGGKVLVTNPNQLKVLAKFVESVAPRELP